MQVTIKSSKVGKRGKNDYGPWVLVVLTTDKDVEYTTLAKEAEAITPGMVIDIDQISIGEKDGKEKRSFKKFEIISGVAKSTESANTNGRPGMTPEMWADKDRLERWSRECNTCFMGIMQVASSGNDTPGDSCLSKDAKFKKAYDKALDWAIKHFEEPHLGGNVVTDAFVKMAEKDWADLKTGEFKNLGEFLTRATKELKLTRDQICEKLSLNDVSEIKDFTRAWKTLTAGL